jgi:hypothetical protein
MTDKLPHIAVTL